MRVFGRRSTPAVYAMRFTRNVSGKSTLLARVTRPDAARWYGVERREQQNIRSTKSTGQFERGIGLHDAPSVDERIANVELIRPFAKKRTSRRVEKCKARIGSDLSCVGFHLRQVWTNCAIEHV